MIVTLALWLLGGVAAFVVASGLALRSYNRFALAARGADQHRLARTGSDTALDRMIDPVEAAHPGESGLATLLAPREALAARLATLSEAGRSVDIISYIWATDLSGRLLMHEILAAADRGVRVRLLLDDVNVQGFDLAFLSLSQHPRIDVRLFNPIRSRGHWLRRGMEFLLGFSRFNRRLHGKVWIADGRVAILGGRNVGDVYFDAPGTRHRVAQDADMIVTGPLIDPLGDLFDSYWNLGLSLPILTLWPGLRVTQPRFRDRLRAHAASTRVTRFRQRCMAGRDAAAILTHRLRWTTEATLLADPPDKAFGRGSGLWMSDAIADELAATTQALRLTTPYLVPGAAGLALLEGLAGRGVDVRVLTNALASTDLPTVHGAYSHYRLPLLRAGVRLHEYAPPPRHGRRKGFLHSKVLIFDGTRAMVGSHNFDLRSNHTNIELGLLFRQPELVAELSESFDRQSAPGQAYALTLERGRLHWAVDAAHPQGILADEPGAGILRRVLTLMLGRIPHDIF